MKIVLWILTLSVSASVHAGTFTFGSINKKAANVLDDDEFEKHFEFDSSANEEEYEKFISNFAEQAVHSIASSPRGKREFGFSVGLIGSWTQLPAITDEEIGGHEDNEDNFLAARLFAAVHVGHGVSVEFAMSPGLLPIQDRTALQTSGAVKWAVSQMFDLPVDVAVGAHFGHSLQRLEGVELGSSEYHEVHFTTLSGGANASVGYTFQDMITPYLTVGYLYLTGEAEKLKDEDDDGAPWVSHDNPVIHAFQFLVGVEANIDLFTAGIEYQRSTNTNRVLAKLGVSF